MGDNGNIHGNAGLPDTAAERRPCVIDCKCRVRIGGYPKVCHTCPHNVFFHPSKYQSKNRSSKQQKQYDDSYGKDRGNHQQLARRLPRLCHLFTANILTCNDCTAGSKGRKQENEYRIKGIDKGYSGHGSFTHKADHKSIRQSNEDRKELFQKQRYDQIFQVFIAEQLITPSKSVRRMPLFQRERNRHVPAAKGIQKLLPRHTLNLPDSRKIP